MTGSLPASKDYDKIVLSENAVSLHVSGDFVLVQERGKTTMVAAVKLAENEHIKFED